jgi:hypothetical protein
VAAAQLAWSQLFEAIFPQYAYSSMQGDNINAGSYIFMVFIAIENQNQYLA